MQDRFPVFEKVKRWFRPLAASCRPVFGQRSQSVEIMATVAF
ncbi:hypothetical protein DVDV_4331 [Desulfovibrio sp. DV]|nr:hypothetical protein DVDV_4331 [Desulfovibrio sp. DV]